MVLTVGIVGAGPSGLVAAKSLLHHVPASTFSVTIFEEKTRIGGLWPSAPDDVAGLVHPLMVTNQSKHTVQFSDLAWEPDSPDFPRAWQVGHYLQRYLERYCKDVELELGSRVESAKTVSAVASDGTRRDGWSLLVKSARGEAVERSFDYLLIATGYFGRPVLPALGETTGHVPVIHSSRYRDLQGLLGETDGRGGKILVVGGQMSGVEIAGTIGSHLSSARNSPGPSPIPSPENYSIHHVVQRPAYVFPLHRSPLPSSPAPPFIPLDLLSCNLSNRQHPLTNASGHISTETAETTNSMYQTILGTDQSEYSPQLAIKTLDHTQPPYVAVSDTYMEFVRSGLITVSRGKFEGLNGRSATVTPSNEEIDNVAAVVCATGFEATSSLSFLPDAVCQALSLAPEDLNHTVALAFHGTHHPSVPNLGFVGFYRAPYWGVMEMQARFLTALWSSGGLSSPTIPAAIKRALEADDSIARTLALRQDPRASQFPMGDYCFLMQEFSAALELPLQPTFGDTPALPPGNKPMDIVTPARYPSAALTPDQAAEARKSLRQTHAAALSSLTGARFVARAVFRSLLGTWRLERDLTSRHPSLPSGHFSGTAQFLLREGTLDGLSPDSQRPGLEYLYIEEGDYRASNGLSFRATRRYIWRYNEVQDRLSVWFVRTDDHKRADYLFHEVEFAVPAAVGGGRGERTGWKATSGHLCSKDFYDVDYEFKFKAVNLQEWRLRYTVNGPKKDYTISGVYFR